MSNVRYIIVEVCFRKMLLVPLMHPHYLLSCVASESLSSLFNFYMQTKVAAIFVFVSFTALLSISGVPAVIKEVEVTLIVFFLRS